MFVYFLMCCFTDSCDDFFCQSCPNGSFSLLFALQSYYFSLNCAIPKTRFLTVLKQMARWERKILCQSPSIRTSINFPTHLPHTLESLNRKKKRKKKSRQKKKKNKESSAAAAANTREGNIDFDDEELDDDLNSESCPSSSRALTDDDDVTSSWAFYSFSFCFFFFSFFFPSSLNSRFLSSQFS